MQPTVPIRSAPRSGSPVTGGMIGAGLVAAGLCLAFLTVETPLAARLVTGGSAGSGQLPFATWTLVLGLVAGAAMLIAGTDRLAAIVAAGRASRAAGSPIARAFAALPDDVDVVRDAIAYDGRPVPLLVIGAFGVATVGELASPDRLRCVDGLWQARTHDGWSPAEPPVDQVTRDADRVRHWLNDGELDFVVRVHAALVTPDPTIPRSPSCAVLTPGQIAAWVDSLPRQRSITEGRRHVLVARARDSVPLSGRRRPA